MCKHIGIGEQQTKINLDMSQRYHEIPLTRIKA